MSLRIGVAGLGVHGSRYARHLLAGDVAGARLAAVSRRDAESGRRFAREHGVAFSGDPLELARLPGVDAVVAVLPPDLHAPLALACLEAGRPVLVEKPLACDAVAAARVAQAAARGGAPLMVAHTLRFDAVVTAIRREIERLGPIRVVAINQRFEPFHRPWIDDPGRGGILLNTGVHGFDLLRFLTGAEPVAVRAEQNRAVTTHTEDQFVAIVTLEPGGILATVDNSRATLGRSGRIEVACEGGQVAGDHIHRTLYRIAGRREVDLGPVEDRPTVPAVLGEFVECVRRDRPPAVSAVDGLRALELIDATRRSAASGRRERV